jgi:hypothetical protein
MRKSYLLEPLFVENVFESLGRLREISFDIIIHKDKIIFRKRRML